MNLKAGFAENDITPKSLPVQIYFGNTDKVLDPIYAKAAVFALDTVKVVIVCFDVVIIEADDVKTIRQKISAALNVPKQHVMISATHNHACPAVVGRADWAKDEQYVAFMLEQGKQAAITANSLLQEVEIGASSGYETRISFNRRFIKRDGTVVSQPAYEMISKILCNESVIDPEVGILAVRNKFNGNLAGIFVNFGSHATHHMGSGISAGFPGVLAQCVKSRHGQQCITLFSNGGGGNIQHCDYTCPPSPEPRNRNKELIGKTLAEHVEKAVNTMIFEQTSHLATQEIRVSLKYRNDLDELAANANNRAYFTGILESVFKRGWYAWSAGKLRSLYSQQDRTEEWIQVIMIGPSVFIGIPAEYFSDLVLRIKEQSPAKYTWVMSTTNGWLGYVPQEKHFARRGGHESTLAWWSKMAPDTGDVLAENSIKLIREIWSKT